ncbi:hypothetical protein KC19_VG041200 [Ceratodon purpureus]|uniref:Uncharacterized protein n=1 Tax=Ceratodon purpureus TaxID=3225 RepID=A0A8T0HLU4_CERPU|nr:hypothetical protein KC19_VG041200 [Ceratodon purpureus]
MALDILTQSLRGRHAVLGVMPMRHSVSLWEAWDLSTNALRIFEPPRTSFLLSHSQCLQSRRCSLSKCTYNSIRCCCLPLNPNVLLVQLVTMRYVCYEMEMGFDLGLDVRFIKLKHRVGSFGFA